MWKGWRRCVMSGAAAWVSSWTPAAGAEFVEAEYLALELTGALLPPQDVVQKIDADLAAIRAYDDFFELIERRSGAVQLP